MTEFNPNKAPYVFQLTPVNPLTPLKEMSEDEFKQRIEKIAHEELKRIKLLQQINKKRSPNPICTNVTDKTDLIEKYL